VEQRKDGRGDQKFRRDDQKSPLSPPPVIKIQKSE